MHDATKDMEEMSLCINLLKKCWINNKSVCFCMEVKITTNILWILYIAMMYKLNLLNKTSV
jgi:hypothetical protein